MHACMHVHIYIYVYIHLCIHNIHTHTYIYICIFPNIHSLSLSLSLSLFVHIYIHTYIHIHLLKRTEFYVWQRLKIEGTDEGVNFTGGPHPQFMSNAGDPDPSVGMDHGGSIQTRSFKHSQYYKELSGEMFSCIWYTFIYIYIYT